jgi:hypothetical protein
MFVDDAKDIFEPADKSYAFALTQYREANADVVDGKDHLAELRAAVKDTERLAHKHPDVLEGANEKARAAIAVGVLAADPDYGNTIQNMRAVEKEIHGLEADSEAARYQMRGDLGRMAFATALIQQDIVVRRIDIGDPTVAE